jgi:hypothetical protein
MPRTGAQFAGIGLEHTRAPPEGRRKVKGPGTEPELVENDQPNRQQTIVFPRFLTILRRNE